jgi:hypothetical protein
MWIVKLVIRSGAANLLPPAQFLAELPNSSAIDKLARKAYCSEEKIESSQLDNSIVSYKQVVEQASNRALIEHPNVYISLYARS